MKVFVRTSDLSNKRPVVVGFYRDDSDVGDNVHGDGMTILTVPMSALFSDPAIGGVYVLVDGWREKVGSLSVRAEAKRRIESDFTISDQLNALHELIAVIVAHGSDVSRWPEAAKSRKAELDEKWNYISDVRERARAHAPSAPFDPASDKAWPRRLAKKR